MTGVPNAQGVDRADVARGRSSGGLARPWPAGALTAPSLNIEQPKMLRRYLAAQGLIAWSEEPQTQVLAGGVSSRVVLVRRRGGRSWVVKQALPRLRVAVEWRSDPDRSHREALALHWLAALGIDVPALVHEDADQHVLVMSAVPEPHRNWKAMLMDGRLTLDHVASFARILAAIHTRSSVRRAQVEAIFADRSHFESLRIEPYYQYTAARVPQAAAFLADVIGATRANRHCFVHGDFSPKNVLVHEGRLVLLDHEVAHFGDPAFDIGFSLAHLLSKAHHLRAHRRHFREAAEAYWDTYGAQVAQESWASGLEMRAARSTLACLLARVAGRSPLEYLDDEERACQRHAVVGLISDEVRDLPGLMTGFVERLG